MGRNRKERRALERKSRGPLKGGNLTKVAGLLSQLEDYKQEVQTLADKVAGDVQGHKFARLLCKVEPLIDPSDLEEGDLELFEAAKRLLK